MDNQVTDYISKTQPWQAALCEQLRQLIRDTLPEAEERLQYGKPHYLINGHYAAVIDASRGKVSFMIFNATDIPEVKGFLRKLGNGERKAVTFTEGQEADRARLADLLTRSVSAIR
ncbi:DUF1801 domain-containing protein [Nocardia brevicatena]|uniref:DUF1801 domain-containing protein n=1 Tax=Nocardia brevicatena TaxID=37327 RepID=UPI000305DEE0|nr:DUF1801 domain-containing protein [Nocardia brevicatena]